MIFPTIHLNGTGRQMLLDDYNNAYRALQEALEAFRKIEFNARDYYVQGAGAWPQARDERTEALEHLLRTRNYLEAHLLHLAP